MINVYINNEEKKLLGFTFYLFGSDEFCMDYDKYDSAVDMNRYLITSKSDILGINIERFIEYCRNNAEAKTVLIDEAIHDLEKATLWRSKNRAKYKDFLSLTKRGDNKLKALVNTLQGEEKKIALMMYLTIKQFIESEIIFNK